MDQDYSFPICVQLAPPSSSSLPKSRAKSMSNDEPPVRKHFHAHRRSAAVSEDLRGVVIPTIRPVPGDSSGSSAAPCAGSGVHSAPPTPGYAAFSGIPHGAKLEVPEGALGAPCGVPPSPKAVEDRKVAFAAPPPVRAAAPDSPRSSQFSPRSPFRSPRRRTLSVFVDDEPPCIDLDEALYSKAVHRRTESLPVAGLSSPFLPPPREIEPVLEEDEHSQIFEHAVESPEQSPVRPAAKTNPAANTARAPRRDAYAHASGSTPSLAGTTPTLGTPTTPLCDRPSGESERSRSSGLSEASIDSKKAKRFSFLRNLSPRLRAQSPPPRSSAGCAVSGAAPSPRAHKLRDIPSVSSLGIPDSFGTGVFSLTPASDSFALGEPGPVAPDKKKRWSFFRR